MEKRYIPTEGVNYKLEGLNIIQQGNRQFIEYTAGCYCLYKDANGKFPTGKSFTYCQCPNCGVIWAGGCGFARHTCKVKQICTSK